MTPTGTAERWVWLEWKDLAGYEAGGVFQSQVVEGLVSGAEHLEFYPKGEVEPLKDMSATCVAKPGSSLIPECMLKLIRIQPYRHLLAIRPWAYVTHMLSASVSSSVQ